MASVITSITGLQNLTGLTRFNADFNGLQSVNLSNLPNLLDVDISDNNIPGSTTHSLRFVNLSGSTAITELRLDDSDFSTGIPDLTGLTDLEWLDMDQCGITGNVDLSILPALTGFDLGGNPGLTSVTIFEQVLNDVNIRNAALTEASVNDILGWLDGGGETGGTVRLEGGTNAAPTGDGLTAVTNLEGKGWNVTVNQVPSLFDVTANWSLTTPAVVNEASFRTFLESGQDGEGSSNSLTNVVITDFSLVGDRITCNLSAIGSSFQLSNIEVTDVASIGSIVGLVSLVLGDNQIVTFDPTLPLPNSLEFLSFSSNQIVNFDPALPLPISLFTLDIGSNQIVTFNPSVSLPNSLNTLYIGFNQMTTAGYTGSEPWANAMSAIPGRGTVYFNGNIDSVSGTNLETILISKGWTVIA